jgi:hypothetical protein
MALELTPFSTGDSKMQDRLRSSWAVRPISVRLAATPRVLATSARERPRRRLRPTGLVALFFLPCALAGWTAASRADHIVLNYQKSQWTGWTDKNGNINTIGGHDESQDFTDGTKDGRTYTISLAPADPIYMGTPSNGTTLPFYQKVLTAAFAANSAFNYVGGFPGENEFNVQSYSAFASNGGRYGADMYVVYNPGAGDPAINGDAHWIQVIWNNVAPTMNGQSYTPGKVSNIVDNDGAANPYYGGVGGTTTINKQQVFNFYDRPARTSAELAAYNFKTPLEWTAENFLVVDTNKLNAKGQEIINVYGGFSWGWQVTLQSTPEPNSLVLVATGAVFAAVLFVRRRRRAWRAGEAGGLPSV